MGWLVYVLRVSIAAIWSPILFLKLWRSNISQLCFSKPAKMDTAAWMKEWNVASISWSYEQENSWLSIWFNVTVFLIVTQHLTWSVLLVSTLDLLTSRYMPYYPAATFTSCNLAVLEVAPINLHYPAYMTSLLLLLQTPRTQNIVVTCYPTLVTNHIVMWLDRGAHLNITVTRMGLACTYLQTSGIKPGDTVYIMIDH